MMSGLPNHWPSLQATLDDDVRALAHFLERPLDDARRRRTTLVRSATVTALVAERLDVSPFVLEAALPENLERADR